jgi:hypothetical protein
VATSVPKELREGAHVGRHPLVAALELRSREIRMKDGKRVVVLASWERNAQTGKLTVPSAAWPAFMRALRAIQPTPARPPRPQRDADDDE